MIGTFEIRVIFGVANYPSPQISIYLIKIITFTEKFLKP